MRFYTEEYVARGYYNTKFNNMYLFCCLASKCSK